MRKPLIPDLKSEFHGFDIANCKIVVTDVFVSNLIQICCRFSSCVIIELFEHV
ncbi:hypothetical protein Hanom_Chr09g00796031 [Helianthus anomalus]